MNPDEHYLLINGETYGPFTLEQMHELWLREELPLDTFYVRKGMKAVRPLEDIINQIIGYRPPEPEAVEPPRLPDRIHPKLVVLIALVVAGLYALLSGLKALYYPSPRVVRLVEAEVRVSPIHIEITNTDTNTWVNTLVRLNDNAEGACQLRLERLEPGQTFSASLINFSTPAGERFEPWRETVLQVWIGGNGYDFRRFIPSR